MSGDLRRALLSLFFGVILISACAKPNYQDDPASAPKVFGKITRNGEAYSRNRELYLDYAWDPLPPENQFGSFVFGFWSLQDPAGAWRDPDATIAVVLWMPSMGHGSAPVKVTREPSGQFRASKVFFPMPGAWEIRFQLKKGSDVVEQIVVPFYY